MPTNPPSGHEPADPRPMSLAERIGAGEQLIGALLRLPNQYLVEAAGLHGFDFVIFDCEHGPADIGLVQQHVTIARSVSMPALVRIPSTDTDGILRVLDAGATGLLVPRIPAPADIARAVSAARYPPRGERGFATYTPAGRYGLDSARQHLAAAERDLVVLAMIEDADGVANAAAIADVDAVTGTLVGPADLAVDLGVPGQPAAAEVVDATARVHEATRAAGRAVMVIVGRPDAAAAAFAGGAQLVLVNVAQAVNDALSGLIAVRAAAVADSAAEPVQR